MSGLVARRVLGQATRNGVALVGLDGQRVGLGLVGLRQAGQCRHGQNMLAPMLISRASTVVLKR
jgi:hypothetical protein